MVRMCLIVAEVNVYIDISFSVVSFLINKINSLLFSIDAYEITWFGDRDDA
jgi:hypothetical protein